MAEAYTVALSAQPQRKEVSTRFEVHINQHQAEVQDGWEVSNRQVAKSAVSVDAHLIDIMHICVCVITSLAHEMTHQTRKCINYVPWNPPFFAWRHCCSFVLNQLLSWKGSDTLKQQFLLITKYTVCSFATHWGDEMNLMFQV